MNLMLEGLDLMQKVKVGHEIRNMLEKEDVKEVAAQVDIVSNGVWQAFKPGMTLDEFVQAVSDSPAISVPPITPIRAIVLLFILFTCVEAKGLTGRLQSFLQRMETDNEDPKA